VIGTLRKKEVGWCVFISTYLSLSLKKRNATNQKYENPENSPFQKPEKSLEVLSHFSLFTEILMLTISQLL